MLPVLVLLVSLLTSCKGVDLPVDCSDIRLQGKGQLSGVYTIYPLGVRSAVKVYCDMSTAGGGWTVFLTRQDGTVNFYRPWDQYFFGFGNPAGEYWLGLDNLYQLTNRQKYELRVDLEDFDGRRVFAQYSSFSVSGECDAFRLNVSGFINGGAGDSLAYHSGQRFSTFDKDHDSSSANCARLSLGAFWYNNCHHANPNGIYRWGADATINNVGVDWAQWKGFNYSLKTLILKIRPLQ